MLALKPLSFSFLELCSQASILITLRYISYSSSSQSRTAACYACTRKSAHSEAPEWPRHSGTEALCDCASTNWKVSQQPNAKRSTGHTGRRNAPRILRGLGRRSPEMDQSPTGCKAACERNRFRRHDKVHKVPESPEAP